MQAITTNGTAPQFEDLAEGLEFQNEKKSFIYMDKDPDLTWEQAFDTTAVWANYLDFWYADGRLISIEIKRNVPGLGNKPVHGEGLQFIGPFNPKDYGRTIEINSAQINASVAILTTEK